MLSANSIDPTATACLNCPPTSPQGDLESYSDAYREYVFSKTFVSESTGQKIQYGFTATLTITNSVSSASDIQYSYDLNVSISYPYAIPETSNIKDMNFDFKNMFNKGVILYDEGTEIMGRKPTNGTKVTQVYDNMSKTLGPSGTEAPTNRTEFYKGLAEFLEKVMELFEGNKTGKVIPIDTLETIQQLNGRVNYHLRGVDQKGDTLIYQQLSK